MMCLHLMEPHWDLYVKNIIFKTSDGFLIFFQDLICAPKGWQRVDGQPLMSCHECSQDSHCSPPKSKCDTARRSFFLLLRPRTYFCIRPQMAWLGYNFHYKCFLPPYAAAKERNDEKCLSRDLNPR